VLVRGRRVDELEAGMMLRVFGGGFERNSGCQGTWKLGRRTGIDLDPVWSDRKLFDSL
jgi:hypothetical protein